MKGKSFLPKKGIPNIGECHAISCFTIVCWHQMIENILSGVSNLLASPEFSTEVESRKDSPHAYRLGEYICRLSVKS